MRSGKRPSVGDIARLLVLISAIVVGIVIFGFIIVTLWDPRPAVIGPAVELTPQQIVDTGAEIPTRISPGDAPLMPGTGAQPGGAQPGGVQPGGATQPGGGTQSTGTQQGGVQPGGSQPGVSTPQTGGRQ